MGVGNKAMNNSFSNKGQPESDMIGQLKSELNAYRSKLTAIERKLPFFELVESKIPDVLSIMDIDLNRLYISPSVYWQRGYTVEEAMMIPFSESVTPESLKLVRQTLVDKLMTLPPDPSRKPITQRLELVMFRKDGSEMIVESDVSLHLDDTGKPAYLVSASRDITSRKRMERDLRDSESRYRLVFTDSLEALSILKNGILVDANQQWLSLHGYDSLSEVTGRNILHFVHPSYHNHMKSRREMTYTDYEPRIYEMMDLRKDGSVVFVEVKSSTIFYDGEPHILSAVRDITETRNAKLAAEAAKQALIEKTQDLQAANKELSRYAFAVSHELKSPVRSAYSLITLLEDDLAVHLSVQQKQYFQGARNALENLRKTIDGMLEISRVSGTSHTLRSIHVKTIVPDVFRRIQNLDGELDLPVEWPVVLGDPILLVQVLSNLVTNGFKFNRSQRKKVRISWSRKESDRIEIVVSDNGIGIENDYIGMIFETFKRLHPREEFEGSGIGLTIVQRAVQRMHGSIRVESQPGIGSKFFVTLLDGSQIQSDRLFASNNSGSIANES